MPVKIIQKIAQSIAQVMMPTAAPEGPDPKVVEAVINQMAAPLPEPPLLLLEGPKAPAPEPAKPAPWEEAPAEPQMSGQKVTEALKLVNSSKQTMMLIHKKSGDQYEVKGWDPETERAVLVMVGPLNIRLNPKVGERENEFYHVVWR